MVRRIILPIDYVVQSVPMANLDSVIQQLREDRDRLDAAIAALESVTDNILVRQANRRDGRRRFSAAAIAKMRAAQRARRARERASQQSVDGKAVSRASRGRRQISPEGLARIRAAQRKRWAKVRAVKKK